MNELDFLRAQVAREHERLLEIMASARSTAAAAYLGFAIRRSLARDRAHAARLETRVVPGDAAAMEAIAALRASFADRDRALVDLEHASAETLGSDGGSAGRLAQAIDAAARAHEGIARHWQALEPALVRHYVIEDWRATSRVDADSILEERALHAAWLGATPA